MFGDDAFKFLTKMLPEADFRMLAGVQRVESMVSEVARPLFRLVMSCIMEAVYLSQTDGVYKLPTTRQASKPAGATVSTPCGAFSNTISCRAK